MTKPIQATTYTFRDIIKAGFLYVDKTRYLYDLVRYPKGTYFISRPRRFGKSLTVSTLEEIFRGNKELFQGLWIYNSDYQWQAYPVIRIDFSLNSVKSASQLKEGIQLLLVEIAEQNGLTLTGNSYQHAFRNLVYQLADVHDGKVVLLIDEYDKPITDNLDNLAEAQQIRDTLRALYGVVKALDRYWRFVFITGISRFSRVGVFSAMNNLDDLTVSIRAANMLGITEPELRHYFPAYINEFAAQEQVTSEDLLTKIRAWYNGFRFAHGGESVYNPFSTIQLFLDKRFSNYWFATGTPTFLIKLLQERDYDIPSLERVEADDLLLQTYELDNLAIVPLLYQTGYLTIKESESDEFGTLYILSYPNNEVRHSFITYLLNAYSGGDGQLTESHLRRLVQALRTHDFSHFFETLNVFFANLDYDLHLEHEKYYQTIFYMIFLLLGIRIAAEMKTSAGRIDAVVEVDDAIFIFEFKLGSTAATALQQSKDRAYAEKYRLHGKPITLIGANFDYKARKLTAWTQEQDQSC
ncbi:MAG: AAA family ATPase [Caldilineaceae bacterium]